MKLKRLLAMLLTLCMVLTLLPGVALAMEGPVTAGTRDELVEALWSVAEGGTITLTASITGDPININTYNKTFSIDKTASNYSYPALSGSYTTSTNYYSAIGYGAEGVTLSHSKTTLSKVETYTYTPDVNSTIAAYVSRETITAGGTVYACTDMETALARISSPYYIFLHLNQDFTGTASTTKTTAFTLIPERHAATGTITYNGTSPYEVIKVPIEETANYSVTFKFISITVVNGETIGNYASAEIADAVTYANSLVGDTTMTVNGAVTISVPLELDSEVSLVISSGKTVTLSAPLTANGSFTNSGTLAFKNGGELTMLTANTVGTRTKPNENYVETTAVNGEYTTYGISAEANGEVTLTRGEGEAVYFGTLAEAVSAAAADVVDTIKLLRNVTAAAGQIVGGSVDFIDLNGYTLSTAAGSYLNASGGNVTFRDSSLAKTGKVTGGNSANGLFSLAFSGNITFESGTFEDLGGTAAVAANGRTPAGTVITVKSGATITSTGYGILIQKAATNADYSDTTVNIYGKVLGALSGITINGQVTAAPTPVINIYDGSEVSGIFAAGYGTWNITGGTISNDTGIYIKSGVMNIIGGAINGNGAKAEPVYNGGGFNHTGDAIIIDSCGYPGGAPSVTISGGTFESANAYALRHVMTQGTTPAQSLQVTGGSFTAAMDSPVISDGPIGFISGGWYDSAPSETLVAAAYQYNSSTKYVVPANAAASIGAVTYPSLALAVNAAKYGDTIELLGHNTETLTVSKVITIKLNGYTVEAVDAGAGFAKNTTETQLVFSISPVASTVVSVAVESEIGDNVSPEDTEIISEVINLTQINGVADALSEDGQDKIIAEARVTPGEDDQVVVEISVAVMATESNLAAGTLTFSAMPTANVYLNGTIKNGAPIPVSNDYLDGSDIEVLLPLPEGFEPEEIVHESTDGSSERFLESIAYPSAAKKFEIVTINGCQFAKLTITKFSTFTMTGKASYVASIDETNYYTLQEAIDAAISGQTITLLQDCSDLVTVSGKNLIIERGEFEFDKSNVTLGANCTLQESGATLTITYAETVTVTLLDITDAIAPINGETPVSGIAGTDQYTGTVTWDGAPAQFAPSQTYTATITLIAKSGYTFEGVAANAFKVPCAMAATNDSDSGVITATFMSPPAGYITDGNGMMAFSYNGYYGPDIQGTYNGAWQQTTCGNAGYGTSFRFGDEDPVGLSIISASPVDVGRGITIGFEPKFYSSGRFLRIVYTLHNSGSETQTVSFGSHADTQIGNDDGATITKFDDARGFKMVNSYYPAQFNFYGKGTIGVTDVDTYWFGYYYDRYNNVFNQIGESSFSGDSGMAYSWQNKTLAPGQTRTFSVLIGIGDALSGENVPIGVNFDSQGGSDVDSITVEMVGDTINAPTSPTRSGYTFGGWYTESECANQFDFTTPITATITLYAKWTQNTPPSGGGSYTPPKYPVTDTNQGEQAGGQIKLSKERAEAGDTVIITVTPDKGYENGNPVVLDTNKKPVEVTDNGNGTFSFKMPSGGVNVETKFSKIDYFDDVTENDWFDEASWYCAAHGLIQGTGHRQFDGHIGTNRAMLVTVLYRLANSTDDLESIFDDVESGKWYSEAIGWAAHNKIVEGYGNGKFGPDDTLTREQMVAVLYRYSMFMKYDVSKLNSLNTFTDADAISEWALQAMKWAAGNGIVEGIGNDLISPETGATRAQFAAMMQRFCANFVK